MYEARRDETPFYRNARFFSAIAAGNLLVQTGFADLRYWQALFHHPDEIHEAEPVRSGHGQGGFVVVVGTKKTLN